MTIETFLNWKEKFDAEIAAIKKRKGLNDTGPKKLTGIPFASCYINIFILNL